MGESMGSCPGGNQYHGPRTNRTVSAVWCLNSCMNSNPSLSPTTCSPVTHLPDCLKCSDEVSTHLMDFRSVKSSTVNPTVSEVIRVIPDINRNITYVLNIWVPSRVRTVIAKPESSNTVKPKPQFPGVWSFSKRCGWDNSSTRIRRSVAS